MTQVLIGAGAMLFATRAQAEAAAIPPDVHALQVLGYAERGDAPIAAWIAVEAEPAHGVAFRSADGRWWEIAPGDGIDIRCIGGRPDCVDTHAEILGPDGLPTLNGEFDRNSTDNTPIFRIAQAYSHERGVPILLSGCSENRGFRVYQFHPDDTAFINITGQRHHLKGSGPATAKIFIDEDADWNGEGLQSVFGDDPTETWDPDENPIFVHEGVEFRGRWAHIAAIRPPTAQGKPGNTGVCAGAPVGREVIVRDCQFNNIRSKGYIGISCRSVSLSRFSARCCTEGVFRALGCRDFQASDFRIVHCSDDALDPAPLDAQTFGPPRSNVTIANGVLIDCQPPAVVGARRCAVSNLMMERCKGGLLVGPQGGGNGATPAFAVCLENITATDTLEAWDPEDEILSGNGDGGAIQIGGSKASLDALNVRIGGYEPVAKAFRPPWATDGDAPALGALHTVVNTAGPSIGGLGVKASGLTVLRTLPDTDDYWGGALGFYFHSDGWKKPQVHAAQRKPNGILISGDVTGLRLSDFLIVGVPQAGVRFNSASARAVEGAYRHAAIENGRIIDARNGVVKDATLTEGLTLSSFATWDVSVANLDVCLDPWHLAPSRVHDAEGRPTGGWTSVAGLDWWAFVIKNGKGWRFENCTVAQCAGAFAGNGEPAQFTHRGTTVVCRPVQPVHDGGATAKTNLGVGQPGSGAEFRHQIVNLDPTSADYGKAINHCYAAAAAQPAAGTWVQGAFVAASQPAIASGKVLRGWTRLTTGAGHVAGTDWTPVYETVS